ncbi:MAG: LamG domain-containing protein [Candidatus Marinimicrobia bacterium]|nr:LamG domain-containing protein [Candidatus Neomarinimicrobiota bacterium]MCF7902025.1 LamG domain-containing protein [Candidatus Neomarinimicrobiota bacterium]
MGKYLITTIGFIFFCGSLVAAEKDELENGIALPISNDSLIAYYPLDNDARDYSGNGLHGTIYGAKPFTDRNARPNPAMYFDGKDDYIDLGNSEKLKPDFPITVAFWFRSDRKYNQNIFTNNYDDDYYNGINVGLAHGDFPRPKAEYGNGGLTTKFGRKSFLADDEIKLNKWYHLVAVYIAWDSVVVLIDGKSRAGEFNGFATNMTYSDGPARIGTKDNNYDAPPWYFKGAIDELFIFNRVLNPNEIRKLMNFTHKPFPALSD